MLVARPQPIPGGKLLFHSSSGLTEGRVHCCCACLVRLDSRPHSHSSSMAMCHRSYPPTSPHPWRLVALSPGCANDGRLPAPHIRIGLAPGSCDVTVAPGQASGLPMQRCRFPGGAARFCLGPWQEPCGPPGEPSGPTGLGHPLDWPAKSQTLRRLPSAHTSSFHLSRPPPVPDRRIFRFPRPLFPLSIFSSSCTLSLFYSAVFISTPLPWTSSSSSPGLLCC